MKILYIADRLEILGGLEMHLVNLINGFYNTEVEIILYTNAMSQIIKKMLPTDVEVIVGFDKKNSDMLLNYNFDVIHAHPFTGISIGLDIANRCDCKFIVTMHGDYSEGLTIEAINRASKVVFVSETARKANPKVTDTKSIIIHNPMDTNKFKKKNKVRKLVKLINPDYKTIVLISRIDDGKEIPMFQLMKILPDLVDRLKGLNILVVGSGKKLPELEKLSNSITPPLKNLNLNFVGEVTNVPDYLSLADLVLACDRAAIEGILCEKIVFYMGLGKWKSLISDDNFEELLFTPGGFAEYSDVELANHLTWMLTQQELVKEKTKMLSDKLREICAVEYITDQLLSVYKKKR